MIFRFFIPLFLSLVIATSGYCFDIVYPLTGHNFKPLEKGTRFVELSSMNSYKDLGHAIVDSSMIKKAELFRSEVKFYGAYDLTDEISINMSLPYVNVEIKVGNKKIKKNDIGDISAGFKYQLSSQNISYTDSFFNFTITAPTGTSPYDIDPATELSTGTGGYSVKPELNLSKSINNSLLFFSLFYQYNIPIGGLNYHQNDTDGEAGVYLKKVEPGDYFGGSIGFVETLHKNITFLLRYNFNKTASTSYDWLGRADYETDGNDLSSIATGFGFKYPDKLAAFTTFSVGIGDEAPDYEFGLSVAF